jgi:hypothetical protein
LNEPANNRIEIGDAIRDSQATLVEHLGQITGYATEIGFRAHAVAETNNDLKALIGPARTFSGPGFLVPTRCHDLFRWCLDHGLRYSCSEPDEHRPLQRTYENGGVASEVSSD